MATEKRLIYANDCPCKNCYEKDYYDCCVRTCYDFAKWMLNSVDAVEVVHGRWEVQSDGYSDDYWKCSACGEEWFFIEDPATEYARVNYCPNCGAKMMDGGSNETD